VSHTVRWSEHVARSAARDFGGQSSSTVRPDEFDFTCGPLAAAVEAFRDFDTCAVAAGPSIRSVHVIDPVFGAVVFIGVLVDSDTIEIADYTTDPDYWSTVDDDPDQ
jgi:hypothetical protein